MSAWCFRRLRRRFLDIVWIHRTLADVRDVTAGETNRVALQQLIAETITEAKRIKQRVRDGASCSLQPFTNSKVLSYIVGSLSETWNRLNTSRRTTAASAVPPELIANAMLTGLRRASPIGSKTTSNASLCFIATCAARPTSGAKVPSNMPACEYNVGARNYWRVEHVHQTSQGA